MSRHTFPPPRVAHLGRGLPLLLLTVGWMSAWGILLAFLAAPLQVLWPPPPPQVFSADRHIPGLIDRLRFNRAGEGVVLEWPSDDAVHHTAPLRRDANGRPSTLEVPEGQVLRPLIAPRLDLEWRTFAIALSSSDSPPRSRGSELWYRVATPDQRRFCLVGYNARSRRAAAWLTRAGFAAHRPPVSDWFAPTFVDSKEPFVPVFSDLEQRSAPATDAARAVSTEYWSGGPRSHLHYLICADGRVYDAALDQRRMHVALTCPGAVAASAEPVHVLTGPELPRPAGAPLWQTLLVRTVSDVVVYDRLVDRQERYVLPQILRNADFTFWALPDGGGVAELGGNRQGYHEALWFERTGRITRRLSLANHPDEGGRGRRLGRAERVLKVSWWGMSLPLALVATCPLLDPVFGDEPGDPRPVWWAGLISSVLAAALIRRHARRHNVGALWLWTLFGFVAGLPGWLAWLGCRRWPRAAAARKGGA